ncbi:hypothetical protein K435DRAFT_800213 [Dendrothele bispora CBS 962.96]|uniref:Uncharacterized protein n=1 Tax=Dendrothele bispora (strain CBS 962.96) TaxID=1314807 RepID=A0A4S8LTC8_DENBC|nr:hypothetical protein K435DRAFT_800213 [Dendrothele bispora CBS 962.96]
MSNKMPQLLLPPMGTRSSNRTAHPGLLDAKGKRRTPQEMAEARAQEQKAKEAKAVTVKAAIQKAAQIEDRQRQEDLKRQEDSRTEKPKANPKARQVTGPRAANNRGVEYDIQRGPPTKKSRRKTTYESDESESNVSMLDAPKRGEIMIEGFDSGSDEYEPQDSGDETSGDVDLEVQKRTALKVLRSAITQHRVTKAAVGTPAINVESSHHKRKASGEKTKGKGKKTKTHTQAVAGLNAAFKKRISSSNLRVILWYILTSVKIEHVEVKKPRTRKEARDGDKKWKMSHLPGGNATQKLFQSAVVTKSESWVPINRVLD